MILTQYGRHGKVFSTPFINQWDHELIDTTFLDLAFEHSIWQRQSCAFCQKDFKMFDSWRDWLPPQPPPSSPRPQPAPPLKEETKDSNSHLLFCFVY